MKRESQQEIINIAEGDEITSIIDKLLDAKSSRLILVFPKNSKIFCDPINLKLLKREASEMEKEISIFVLDAGAKRMAKKVGIKILENLYPAKKGVELDEDSFFNELFEIKETAKKEAEEQIANAVVESANRTQEEKEVKKITDIIFPSDLKTKSEKLKKEEEIKKETEILPKPKEIKKAFQPSLENQYRILEYKYQDKRKLIKTFLNFLASKSFLVIIISAFLFAGVTLYLILPQAKIIITPKKDKGIFSFSVVADKSIFDINFNNMQIPAQSIEFEKILEKEFSASGKKYVEKKAEGEIIIYNTYSSSPQIIVKNTRFESADNKIFRIPQQIMIPGAKIENGKIVPSEIKVKVIADEPGEEYNIGPTDFTIPGFKGSPKFNGFYAKSHSSMTGGFKGEVTVIVKDDLDKAVKELENMMGEVKTDLQNKIPSSLKLIDGAMKFDTDYIELPQIETPAEKFLVKLKVKISAILFNEKDLESLTNEKIIYQLPEDKMQILSTKIYEYSAEKADFDEGKLFFSVKITEDIVSKINADYIKENLLNKDENEIKKFFSQELSVENIQVIFWPFWVSSVPENKDKIKIKISY